MGKAGLIMDMPESCSKCVAYESGGYNEKLEPYDGACFFEKRCMNGHKVTKGRAPWCPLVPVPEKKAVMNRMDDETNLFRKGWNACVDAFLKAEGK